MGGEAGGRLATSEVGEVAQWAASAGPGTVSVGSGSNGACTQGAGTAVTAALGDVLVAGLVAVLMP